MRVRERRKHLHIAFEKLQCFSKAKSLMCVCVLLCWFQVALKCPNMALFQSAEAWGFPWEVALQRVGLPGRSLSSGWATGWLEVRVLGPCALLAPFLTVRGVLGNL